MHNEANSQTAVSGAAGNNFRYDYFIIWSYGKPYAEEILAAVGAQKKFEIVEAMDYTAPDLVGFVKDLYKYDSVPPHLIHLKTDSLKEAGADMIILYLKHHEPDFYSFPRMDGDGVCWRSKYLSDFKNDLRKRFKPIDDEKQTGKNILHASDYEEQVDHLLKMLGYGEGMEYLYLKYGRPDPVQGTLGNSHFEFAK